MRTQKFKAGETILTQGEEGNTAFLILDGSVSVTIGEGAKAKKIGDLSAGEVFGEMSLLEPGPRSATVTATTDTDCIVTSYDDFVGLIESSPDKAMEFMKTLVRRLRHMNELMATMGPRRRGLREMFNDWQKTLAVDEEEMDDEARRRYNEMMAYGMMWF